MKAIASRALRGYNVSNGGSAMKKLIGCLLLLSSVCNAAFVPATVTKQNQATKLMDVRLRVEKIIAARAEQGYHYASVDMDGASFKTEKVIMNELRALGYVVDFDNDHHTFGWNDLNGALLVKW